MSPLKLSPRVAVLLVIAGAGVLSTPPALASYGVLGSFGMTAPATLNEGIGIAVDPNTSDVYVADRIDDRVVKYDRSGTFILMFGRDVNETTGGNICTAASGNVCKTGVAGSEADQFNGPSGVAVDPTSGDVYVNADGNKIKGYETDSRVERFSSNGQYRSEIIGGQNGAPEFGLDPYLNGIVSDTEGALYVVAWNGVVGYPVLRFNSVGEYTGESFLPPGTGGPPMGGSWEWSYPTDVAVDASGNVYVSQSFGHPVVRFSPMGEAVEALPCKRYTKLALATNLFNGELFLEGTEEGGGQQYICRFDASGKVIEEFQAAESGHGLVELAYGASAGILYEDYGKEVVMYGTFPLPTEGAPVVSREDWSNVGETSVTLSGRVNPHSVDTSYSFEYATSPDFSGATSVPAVAADAGSGFLPVTESVNLTGLLQSTTYYYRLVAHNAFGGGSGTTIEGPSQTFTTLAPVPSVTTGEAGDIAYNEATVDGMVVPGSMGVASETMWCFQYGTTSTPGYDRGYVPGTPAGDAGQGTSAVPVSVRLTRLAPDTTYRYRLLAVNSLGLRQPSKACGTEGGRESDGAEGTFKTAASGPGPLAASGPLAGLSQNAATLTGMVDPRGTRTVYDFQLGTDESYGVDLFGEAGAGMEPEPVSTVVSSLQPGTTYHYRLLASSRYGTSYGTDLSFTTPTYPASIIFAPLAAPLLAPAPIGFPSEPKTTSKCKRGYKPDKHGKCVKTKPKKKTKNRGKSAHTRR